MIWVGRLISAAILLQTFELFFVEPWSWEILKEEFPRFLRPVFKSNSLLLGVRFLAAVVALAYPNPWAVAVLFLTTWWINVRWRGTFNGGSDAMTFVILGAWLIASIVPWAEQICLLFVVIQLILSYLVAGVAKVLSPQWRNGEAPYYFLSLAGLELSPTMAFALGWGVTIFECLSPIAAFFPREYFILAMLFHLVNTYLFGLNRFFFVWLAAYPALFASVVH